MEICGKLVTICYEINITTIIYSEFEICSKLSQISNYLQNLLQIHKHTYKKKLQLCDPILVVSYCSKWKRLSKMGILSDNSKPNRTKPSWKYSNTVWFLVFYIIVRIYFLFVCKIILLIDLIHTYIEKKITYKQMFKPVRLSLIETSVLCLHVKPRRIREAKRFKIITL